MSDLDVGAGAHLDLGPLSLKAIADLSSSVESLKKQFESWRSEEGLYQYGATDHQFFKTITGNTGANVIVGLTDGPEPGWIWEIRRLAISYNDPSTGSQTGTAYIFQGSGRPPVTPLIAGNWIDWTGGGGASLPSVAFYSSRQIMLHSPDKLWIALVGSAAVQYVVNGAYVQYPDKRTAVVADI
jgi:hypothetical protein